MAILVKNTMLLLVMDIFLDCREYHMAEKEIQVCVILYTITAWGNKANFL